MIRRPVDCPLCEAPLALRLNAVTEPVCCPTCGCRIKGAGLLLEYWERERMVIELIFSSPLPLETRLSELESDSLVVVELVMLLEENITVVVSEADYEALSQSQTVRELLSRLSHLVGTQGE